MVKPELPNNNNNDDWEAWLQAALKRISTAEDVDNQVNREIVRYWHDRVRNAGDNADELRRIRAEISQLIMNMP
jgi:hypothetical protein